MQILDNLLYKVRCTTTFKDGNMPAGFQNFIADKIYHDIPGNVLKRMVRSDPGAFEIEGYKPKEAEKPSMTAAAEKLLEEFPVPIEDIKGTGKDGTITKADIEELLTESE